MAVVLLLVALMRGVVSTDVRKCCPDGSSLIKGTTCAESNHRWLYGNLSYGLPECDFPSLVPAEEGNGVACLDSFVNGTFAALVCPNSNYNNVTVPNVNLIPKCCPLGRKYDSSFRYCLEEDESDRRALQHFMNVVVSGFSGIVDVDIGFPQCSNKEVIVDYLVPEISLRRQESEAIRINIPGESRAIFFNPEEICVDATENHSLFVVRACQDAYQTCKVRGETCLRKCCQEGFHFTIEKECQLATRGVGPLTVYNVSGPSSIVPLDGKSPALFHGMPCRNGMYILNPDYDPKDAHVFDVKGRLYLLHLKTFVEDYCFEDVFRPSLNISGTYVFLCFPEAEEPVSPKFTFWVPLGLIVSCFFLLITFIVYACLPSLQNLHGKTLMCYVASLLSGYLCLASMLLDLVVPFLRTFNSCIIIGSASQFAILASFCWLNVISFDIWWTFGGKRLNAHIGKKTRDIRRFILYSIYGWGVPALLTAATQISDYTSFIPNDLESRNYSCWFSILSLRHILFFVLPQTLTVGSNVVFYILTVINCSRVKNELNRFKHTANEEKRFRTDVGKLVMNVKLFVVMGISWVMEIVSYFAEPESWGWILVDGTNSLLGLLIFCIFVLKKKVVKAFKRRVGELFYHGRKGRLHRSSTSTLFTVISTDNPRINNNQVLTKSASDSKLNIIIRKNNLNVSISDFNRH